MGMYKEKNLPIGYKQTKIGIIPTQWAVKSLAECFSISAGRDLMKETFSATKTIEHCFPIFSNSMENRGLYGYTSNPRYTAGSLTVTGRGTLGVAEFRTESFDAIIRLLVLTPKMELCGKLIAEYINYRKPFFFECTGIPQLTAPQISKILIPIPPIEEQKKIAEILSEWDKAIELQTKLIEKLELRKRALMQRLLTGRVRLNGFSDKWRKVKLGEFCERIVRKNISNNKNVMTISAQKGFVPQTDFFSKTIASETLDNYYLVHKDEFCYNKSYSNGYPMGAIKRLKEASEAVVTTLYICFKLKENTDINIEFFEQFCEFGGLNKGLVKVANEGGRAHGLLNVTPNDFFNIKLAIPSAAEQNAISERLAIADKEIEYAKTKHSLLHKQKRSLMQQLLTGKKRIKIWQKN